MTFRQIVIPIFRHITARITCKSPLWLFVMFLTAPYIRLHAESPATDGLTVHINMSEIFDTHVARQWNVGTDMEHLRRCREAVARLTESGDTLSMGYCTALNELAMAYLSIGDTGRATNAVSWSGPLVMNLCGENSVESAATYYIYALATAQSGEYFDAADMASVVLRILRDIEQTSTETFVDALLLRASCYSHTGVLGSARKDVMEAVELSERIFSKDSRTYDRARFQAAQIMYRYDNGISPETMRRVADCYEWRNQRLGPQHPETVTALLALANFKMQLHEYAESERLYAEFYALQMANVKANFIYMTLEEQRQYWADFEHYYLELIPQTVLEKVEHSRFASTPSPVCYNTALFSKGILLNSENLMQEALRQSNDGEGLRLKAEIQEERVRLMQQLDLPAAKREVDVSALQRSINQKQQRLLATLQGYQDYTSGLTTAWQQVKSCLRADEGAVEFLRIPRSRQLYTRMLDETEQVYYDVPTDIAEDDIYAAVVLSPKSKEPIFIPLFNLKDFGELTELEADKQRQLSRLIWQPILSVCGDVKRIFFSPVGELYNQPIESFPHWQSGLVADRLALYRLSSTRELLKRGTYPEGQGAAVYGGLNYDAELTTSTSSERGAVGGLGYLAGTLTEANQVAFLLSEKGINVNLLTGDAGDETSFRQLSGQHCSIIHIGTHGFYMTDENKSHSQAEEITLMRSGLFLAGADNVSTVTYTDASDGVLTSQDVSQMDLRGLSFVALSACETAQGKVSGDGVFGLQRGFKKAGAQSILMSLWKVDDEATCLLMTEFYKNWMGGATKHDALEAAKQTVRSHTEKGWDDPKYWAAFILLDALD
ncbi:MAG: CHAT domain-containing protein [Bacteroidaceae bacterium]|nr:CHAT domain-containing protein [Bacteroidaceae bacterium]